MTAKRIFPARICQLLLYAAIFSGLAMGNVLADPLNIKSDAPETYTVVKGDTLWDISGKYLEKPWRWPELWEGNPQIANPHLIYPGDVISLHYIDGQPRLGINRARGVVKLSPKVRATPIDTAIPVIPVEAIQQFLRNPSILDDATIENGPYVISGQEGHIRAAHGDRVYVVGLTDSANKSYRVYNQGEAIKDPVTGAHLGYEGIFVGDAKLDTFGDPSTLLMTSSAREVAIGDFVVVKEGDDALTDIYPKVPDQQLTGRVLEILDGVGVFGRFQTVIINLGASDGLVRGHVLSAFSQGETVNNTVSPARGDTVTLPDERAGTLMILETYDKLSYALAMESRTHIRVMDEVRTPE